jgi:hypothetical protein
LPSKQHEWVRVPLSAPSSFNERRKMPDQTSIFEEKVDANQEKSTQSPANPLDSLLAGIKNEAGTQKYASLEEALKALQHAQAYIPELTKSLKAKEDELATAKTEAARVAELENSVKLLLTPQENKRETPPSVGISKEDVAAIVSQTLAQKQTEAASSQNIASVVKAVKDRFGEKAESAFYEKASQLGLSPDAINQLAATSPTAALTLLGLDKNASSQRQSGGFNSDGFKPTEESLISRNKKSVMFGATGQDLKNEASNVRGMIGELSSHGLTVHDLTDPKIFFKHFN